MPRSLSKSGNLNILFKSDGSIEQWDLQLQNIEYNLINIALPTQ